jgi:pimeloyl-ACP methyl ester carboxylesterase
VSALIIDDEVVHYEVLGRGRPLIFLHGWLGSWRYWIPSMQVLSAEYRTYALDLWGFGDTSKPAHRFGLSAQAELVQRFMDQLGILKAAFVGHGLGAAVAMRFGRLFPDWADRVMGVGLPLAAAAVSPRLQGGSTVALIEWLLGKEPATEPMCREAAKAAPEAVATSVREVMEADVRAELAELRPPYLLVYGEKDPMISPPDEAWLAGLTGSVHSLGFEESRHFPMLDEPAKFNRLLADFLTLKSGESLVNLALKEEWKRRVR